MYVLFTCGETLQIEISSVFLEITEGELQHASQLLHQYEMCLDVGEYPSAAIVISS
jgi:hypothetical protein